MHAPATPPQTPAETEAAPQVLAAPPAPESAPGATPARDDEAAAARAREREAKARLLAIRRVEWVGIAIATVVLGSFVWSTRSRSDAQESLRSSFNAAPIPMPRGAERLAAWRDALPEEVKEASQAIRGQLDAFKRDDFEKAASWQSEELKAKYGSVDAFRRAIKGAYPAFASYKGIEFGPAQALKDGKALSILVRLRGPQNEDVPAQYLLIREGGAKGGSKAGYRIAAVSTPEAGPPKGAPQAPPKEPSPEAQVV